MAYFNYHTHTTFCDGKNTPEEMVLSAIASGLETLGFSGHAPAPDAEEYGIKSMEGYVDCINRLKDKYSDRIRILCGIERDIRSYSYDYDFDYVIGAVHSIRRGDKYYPIDRSPEDFSLMVNEIFGGDGEALVVEYMNTVKSVPRLTGCDIIAHFDLVSKFNGDGDGIYFDPRGEAYLAAAREAIEGCARSGVLFEVNTGAISRGWRKTPYPTPEMLRMIKSAGGRVTFGSDSHAANTILCCSDEAEELVKACGFDGFTRLTCDK